VGGQRLDDRLADQFRPTLVRQQVVDPGVDVALSALLDESRRLPTGRICEPFSNLPPAAHDGEDEIGDIGFRHRL
jgi:hypothetical protein